MRLVYDGSYRIDDLTEEDLLGIQRMIQSARLPERRKFNGLKEAIIKEVGI